MTFHSDKLIKRHSQWMSLKISTCDSIDGSNHSLFHFDSSVREHGDFRESFTQSDSKLPILITQVHYCIVVSSFQQVRIDS